MGRKLGLSTRLKDTGALSCMGRKHRLQKFQRAEHKLKHTGVIELESAGSKVEHRFEDTGAELYGQKT